MNRNSQPPPLTWPRRVPADLDGLRQEETRLAAKPYEVGQELNAARNAQTAAPDLDRRAYAKALRAGTPPPKVSHQQTADDAVAKAERDLAGVGQAQWEVRDEIVATVERLRQPWSADLHAAMDQARQQYAEAVQALIGARDNLTRCVIESEWLDRWPDRPILTMRYPNVEGVIGRNGDPMLWQTIASALVSEADTLYRPAKPEPEYDTAADLAVMRDRSGEDLFGHDHFTTGIVA